MLFIFLIAVITIQERHVKEGNILVHDFRGFRLQLACSIVCELW